jgi:hypothetical protein
MPVTGLGAIESMRIWRSAQRSQSADWEERDELVNAARDFGSPFHLAPADLLAWAHEDYQGCDPTTEVKVT